ncbi:hypothetical protein MACH09_40510 [Vibrio sp. MACH09]|nr:hypothetical protein MACH09_40510 [Vibrio sp. MACH09]
MVDWAGFSTKMTSPTLIVHSFAISVGAFYVAKSSELNLASTFRHLQFKATNNIN